MTDVPKVSIAMGVYNDAPTVGRAIESILNQQFTDFEFLICDDGSTDDTRAVIETYALKDSRIRLIVNSENKGLSYSLNRCVKESLGTYVARMDADDIALPERLSKQIAFMENNPVFDICGSSLYLFDENGIWGNRDYPEYPCKKDFLFGSPFAHPTVVFRKSSLDKCGGYRTGKNVGRSEDYDLFMRMYAQEMRGHNFKEYLFNYCESRISFRKRKFKYALIESFVRFRGYRILGLLPAGLPYMFKPLLISLIPDRLQIMIRKRYYRVKNREGKNQRQYRGSNK